MGGGALYAPLQTVWFSDPPPVRVLIKFTIQYEPSIDEVLSETIWFSDHTGFPKGIIQHWGRQGLRFISDMFKPSTGQLYTKEEMQEKFQIHMTFLCYERLVRKLSNNLQSTGGRSIQSPNIPFKIKMMQIETKCTKFIYNIFVKAATRGHQETGQRFRGKWESEIGEYITRTSVQLMKATKSSYLLYFHYRIVHRMFPTNKLLYAMNISLSSSCTFCQIRTETLAHLFWHCPKVQLFIKEVLAHIKRKYLQYSDEHNHNWMVSAQRHNQHTSINHYNWKRCDTQIENESNHAVA